MATAFGRPDNSIHLSIHPERERIMKSVKEASVGMLQETRGYRLKSREKDERGARGRQSVSNRSTNFVVKIAAAAALE